MQYKEPARKGIRTNHGLKHAFFQISLQPLMNRDDTASHIKCD